MYYIVVIINSKAVQIFLLCLNNFPPKVTVFKRFKCRNKKEKSSPPGLFKVFISHQDQSHFLAALYLSLRVSKKPSAPSIGHIRVNYAPSSVGQVLQRSDSSDTSQLSYSSEARLYIYEHPLSLFISLSLGKRNYLQFKESPFFMFSRQTKGRV